MTFKQKIIAKVQERNKCQNCSLFGKTVVVYDRLYKKGLCDILFIGINPGKDEAIQGKPFIGRSGQILRKTLEEVGLLKKYNVAFTNAILCSTPNEKEIPDVKTCIENCSFLVHKIFKKLNPRLFVPVGANCAIYVFGMKGSITNHSGYVLPDKDNVIPIIHPASLLYSHNEQTKAKFVNSLKRIKQYLDSQ